MSIAFITIGGELGNQMFQAAFGAARRCPGASMSRAWRPFPRAGGGSKMPSLHRDRRQARYEPSDHLSNRWPIQYLLLFAFGNSRLTK